MYYACAAMHATLSSTWKMKLESRAFKAKLSNTSFHWWWSMVGCWWEFVGRDVPTVNCISWATCVFFTFPALDSCQVEYHRSCLIAFWPASILPEEGPGNFFSGPQRMNWVKLEQATHKKDQWHKLKVNTLYASMLYESYIPNIFQTNKISYRLFFLMASLGK